jgi:hypothetical protein
MIDKNSVCMRRIFVTLLLALLILRNDAFAQSLRFFEFTTQCGHGNWQDTSFLAATADTQVINQVLNDLQKPYDERRFISGSIDYGNGGYNHNQDHWFLWHFVPGEWELAEMAIEVCDGCPFSDIDADTAYWVGTLGIFCPWSGKPAREIPAPVILGPPEEDDWIQVFPNPATNVLFFHYNYASVLTISLYDLSGRELIRVPVFKGHELVLPFLKPQLCLLKIESGIHTSFILLKLGY